MLCCQARGKEDDHIGVKEDMQRTVVTEVDARDSLRSYILLFSFLPTAAKQNLKMQKTASLLCTQKSSTYIQRGTTAKQMNTPNPMDILSLAKSDSKTHKCTR